MSTPFEVLIGDWVTEASHPALPDVVVRGRATFEWGSGRRFVVWRAENEHPQFPDSVSILGAFDDEPLSLHYFDSRGVRRVYTADLTTAVWHLERDHPGFSQRWDGRISDGGSTLAGVWQLCEDGETWADDLAITFRRS
jgi:hypothetical protein